MLKYMHVYEIKKHVTKQDVRRYNKMQKDIKGYEYIIYEKCKSI